MKKKTNTIAAVLLSLMLLAGIPGMTASPAYADSPGPEIYWQPSDMWLWPGEVAELCVILEDGEEPAPPTAASLEYWSSYYNDWEWFTSCSQMIPGDNYAWEAQVDPKYWESDYITFRFVISYDGGTLYSREFTVEWSDYTGSERIYGSDRYETAIKVADQIRLMDGGILSQYPNVIIACGTNFADALGGACLAEKFYAPILLVSSKPDSIQKIAAEIHKNMNEYGMIFILGGEGAVSADMEKALFKEGFKEPQIVRFAGNDRYDTNLRILKYCEVYRSEILICSGTNFADALSASAVGLPIVLAGKQLTSDQLEYIGSTKPTDVTLIGGEGAVTKAVEDQVSPLAPGLQLGLVDRLAGADRYHTSRLVAEKYFLDSQRFFATLAYAKNFPDGLSGGPLAMRLSGPLLLVDDAHYEDAKMILGSDGLGSRMLFVLGGPSLISDKTVAEILKR